MSRALLSAGAAFVGLLCVRVPEARAINANACGEMMEEYTVAPYHSWGSAPADVQQVWNESDCNHKICRFMAEKYDVEPHKSWGSLPEELQKIWDTPEVDCNDNV